MRFLRLLALGAALVVPAAAAHAQWGVYVGPSVPYAAAVAPVYAPGYWVPGHWSYGPSGRYWIGPQRAWYGDRHHDSREDWREHRDWDRDRAWHQGWDRHEDRERRW